MTIGKWFLLEIFMHICLPQSLTDVMKLATLLSHCAMHWIDVCPYMMAWWWIHPLMCAKSVLSWATFLPSDTFGVDPCYLVFQVNNISSDHFSIFHFRHVYLDGDNPSYIGIGVVDLCLCHMTQTIVAFQHTNNEHFHVQPVVLMT